LKHLLKPKKIIDKINKEIHIPTWLKATNKNIMTYNEELSNSNIEEIHTILVNAINEIKKIPIYILKQLGDD
jgi:hypothetical protein